MLFQKKLQSVLAKKVMVDRFDMQIRKNDVIKKIVRKYFFS